MQYARFAVVAHEEAIVDQRKPTSLSTLYNVSVSVASKGVCGERHGLVFFAGAGAAAGAAVRAAAGAFRFDGGIGASGDWGSLGPCFGPRVR